MLPKVIDKTRFILANDPNYKASFIVFEENSTKFNRLYTWETLVNSKLPMCIYKDEACFAPLKYLQDKFNRILYRANYKHRADTKTHLTESEKVRWWLSCKRHGLFPWYISENFCKTGDFILRFDNFSLNRLYLMLMAARYVQEYPHAIKATFYLQDHGLNFFLALLAANRCTVINQGHSIFKQTNNYYRKVSPHEATIDPREALALKIYIREGHEGEKPFIEQLNSGKNSSFMLHDILGDIISTSNKMRQLPKSCSMGEIFYPHIQKFFI